jgi:ABC-type tungstate transport system permease subunit
MSVAASMLIAPSLARADSSSTFTVVGTSEVNDSGLMSHVIASAFEGAYPQYTFKFVSSTSSQAAITAAQAGGPSVLIAADPTTENQFVASGDSYEPSGRALFSNNFVFAGPGSTDPAGVKANAAANIAQAFADVAAAGIAGKAEFVSRGGSSGTTIEEHAIWVVLEGAAARGAHPLFGQRRERRRGLADRRRNRRRQWSAVPEQRRVTFRQAGAVLVRGDGTRPGP